MALGRAAGGGEDAVWDTGADSSCPKVLQLEGY
jgi:hypothetical protein